MILALFLLALAINVSLSLAVIANNGNCSLYLAESTIPSAGLGIFSATAVDIGQSIGYGDLCIPLIDMRWHNGPLYNPVFLDYIWSGDVEMARNIERGHVWAFCYGLDAVSNCHLGLINAQKGVPKHEEGQLDPRDPRRGSFSPYHNGTTVATRHIPSGAEIFKYYGDSWFSSRDEFRHVPLSDDYHRTQKLLDAWSGLGENADLYQLVLEAKEILSSPKVLPLSVEEAKSGARNSLAASMQAQHVRSLDYLQAHGRCLDHIRPGVSRDNIKGAFATRSLPKGSVVSTSPVLHMVSDTELAMYAWSADDGVHERHVDHIVGYQLLFNYCFRDAQSPILLCPYGSTVNYINHAQAGGKGPKPNVRIQWANDFVGHKASLLETMSLEDLVQNSRMSFFSIEYVALRDIEPGEEVVMDYGMEWETAWRRHVKTFQGRNGTYVSAAEMNQRLAGAALRTVREQEVEPYAPHLYHRCHRHLMRNNDKWPSTFDWNGTLGLECLVLDRFVSPESEAILYTVEIETHREEEMEEGRPPTKQLYNTRRTDVPRDAIIFDNVPSSTDLHLDGAFRHPIGLPIGMIPSQWKRPKALSV